MILSVSGAPLTDPINQLIELGKHQPLLQLDEVGDLLSISSASIGLSLLATIEAVEHHGEEHLVTDGLSSHF